MLHYKNIDGGIPFILTHVIDILGSGLYISLRGWEMFADLRVKITFVSADFSGRL